MTTEIKLPELGENVKSGDLINVLVSAGDVIAKDQVLLELETEKATIEVPSPAAGVVKEVHVKQGEQITVGQLLFTVDTNGRTSPGESQPAPAKQVENSRPSQPAAETPVASKKAAAEVPPAEKPSPAQPKASRPFTEPQQPPKATIAKSTGTVPKSAEVHHEESSAPADAAPAVRRLARELGVDIHHVSGSGANGHITEVDVKDYAKRVITQREAFPSHSTDTRLPDFSRWGEIERQPMSNVRRTIAEHLTDAWHTVPHVYQFDNADITALEVVRERYSRRRDTKITLTAIALKVAAFALEKFPYFKASVDMASDEIIYKKYCHVGVAVDTERGLLVPVIRDANRKTLSQIATELAGVSEKARSKKLTLDEMSGGVFSITNLGGIGGTGFSPIVNYPEVAILGISRASHVPKIVDSSYQLRLMLPLSLSYDHRVIDGADGARFLRWIAESLEDPARLLFEI